MISTANTNGSIRSEDLLMDFSENTVTAGAAYAKGKLYDLSLNDLLVDPNQPRKVMEARALEELAASIGKHGVLEPILFRCHQGNLIVVAGERRIAAARKAGLRTVPALCVDGNPSEIALVENLLRQDLTAVEEAEALQRLLEQQRYTHEQLSIVIGKARTTISDILLINRLPQEIREECRGDRAISRKILIDIARRKQERAMLTSYRVYRERLQNPRRPRRRGAAGNADPLEAAARMAGKTLASLHELDTAERRDDGDWKNLQATLVSLKVWIDAFLGRSLPETSSPAKEMSGWSRETSG